jgi:D-amino peptidase
MNRRTFSKCLAAGAGFAAVAARRACGAEAAASLKVYVFADMEGISGITNSEQTLSGGSHYREGCRLMAEDINACVAGCFDAGATDVVVRDGHGGGMNVDPKQIDSRAKLIQGATPDARFKDLEGSEALILLGYHGMARTPDAVLAHTYSSATIQGMWLNGREVGETGVDAAIAAEHGVPVVLVSGDDKVIAEALSWLDGIVTCEVKKGTGHQRADCRPAAEAHQLIRKRTAEAVLRRKAVRLIQVRYPVTLRWDYLPKGSLRTYDLAFKPVADPRRVEKTGESVERLFLSR